MLSILHRFESLRQTRGGSVRATVGKSDPVDAYTAAQAARTGRAAITPKDHSGIVESIRMLSTARASAVKARSVALNQIRDLVITAPVLREKLAGLTTRKMVAVIWSWRPNRAEAGDPVQTRFNRWTQHP